MAWLFQVNPKRYDIDGALRTGNPLPMSLRQYANEVAAGEDALLWRSGTDGGIIATGTVTEVDRDHPPLAEWELPFVRDTVAVATDSPKAILGLTRCRVVRRTFLKDHPTLSRLLVLRRPNSTVYRIDPDEWLELAEFIEPSGS